MNFELNSIRELSQRLTRLIQVSSSGHAHNGGGTADLLDLSNASAGSGPNLGERNGRFPTHINLEISKSHQPPRHHPITALKQGPGPVVDPDKVQLLERQIQRLKEQNQQLTLEVGKKSNQVTSLENEKRSLIRQIFQQPLPNLTKHPSHPSGSVPVSGTHKQPPPSPTIFSEQENKCVFQQTHDQGLCQLFLTMSWDLSALHDKPDCP